MDIRYDNIVSYLEKEFPEFKNYYEYSIAAAEENKILPYVYVGTFANFINDEIIKDNSSEKNKIVERIFYFLNDQFSNSANDPRLITLLAVEFLEHFTYTQKLVKTAQSELKGKALEQFHETLKWFKTPEK